MMFGFGYKKFHDGGWGFVAMIFGREISYAHYPENIGVSWRRLFIIGSRRYYMREDWSRLAIARGRSFTRLGRP